MSLAYFSLTKTVRMPQAMAPARAQLPIIYKEESLQ